MTTWDFLPLTLTFYNSQEVYKIYDTLIEHRKIFVATLVDEQAISSKLVCTPLNKIVQFCHLTNNYAFI